MMEQPPNQDPRRPIDPRRHAPPPPPPGYMPPPMYMPPPGPRPSRRNAWTIITAIFGTLAGLVLAISLMLNLWLGVIVASQMEQPVTETVWRAGDSSQRVVILPVTGMIDDNATKFVRDAIDSLEANVPAAVVLRVDSGGGSVSASDEIWHLLDSFHKKHPNVPLIASFGSMAASGGYYISSPADYIVAEPSCITGSIGVIAMNFTFESMMEKIGVAPHVLVANQSPEKDVANNLFREWTPGDSARVQKLIDHYYELFVARILAGGRSLTDAEVRAVANGDIYTAEAAVQNKLVDQVGFLDAAIAEAESRAHIPPGAAQVVKLDKLNLGLLGAMSAHQSSPGLTLDAQTVRGMAQELAAPQMMYAVQWR